MMFKKQAFATYTDINGGKYAIYEYSKDTDTGRLKSITLEIPYDHNYNINRGEGYALAYLDPKTEKLFVDEISKIQGSYNGGLSGPGHWIFPARSLDALKAVLPKIVASVESKILASYKDAKNQEYRIYLYSQKGEKEIAVVFPQNPQVDVFEFDEKFSDFKDRGYGPNSRAQASLSLLDPAAQQKFADNYIALGGTFSTSVNGPRAWIFPYKSLDAVKKLLQEVVSLTEGLLTRGLIVPDSNFFRDLNRLEKIIRVPTCPELLIKQVGDRKAILISGTSDTIAMEAGKYVSPLRMTSSGSVDAKATENKIYQDFKVHLTITVNDAKIDKLIAYMSYKDPIVVKIPERPSLMGVTSSQANASPDSVPKTSNPLMNLTASDMYAFGIKSSQQLHQFIGPMPVISSRRF
jgi:hypothetical protein